jgi:ferritin-like metal-binding protein YciE
MEMEMSLDSMRDLLVRELRDLYSAGTMVLKALPALASAVTSRPLRHLLVDHSRETELQLDRLEHIFAILGTDPWGLRCRGMEGLVDASVVLLTEHGDQAVREAAIAAEALRIGHYLIAGYNSACRHARHLWLDTVVDPLTVSLGEVQATTAQLTTLAEHLTQRPLMAEATAGRVTGLHVRGEAAGA